MTEFARLFRIPKITVFMIWLGLACVCCLPSNSQAANRILNIRHWVAPDHTRIVIDTVEKARYRVARDGRILSLYFRNCEIEDSLPNSMILNKRGVEKIIHEPLAGSRCRVDLLLDEKAKTSVFNLRKVADKPYRIVVDIEFPEIEKRDVEERAQAREQQRDRIIVIDPGHGGDDPGAIGANGTYEKAVVLDISRKLRSFLNQQPGYRAVLTRDGDYYVPFKKRLQIAREYGAAMFISVHADAAANREARGSSVYCLSPNGASSAAARILANKENLADLVGGSPNGESSEASDPIVLNMCQTNTLNVSRNFGEMLLNSLGRVGYVKFRNIQEAQLRVLKLPEIPSVLIEAAYISNAEEEEWLKDPSFQFKMAESIGKAVCAFEPSAPVKPSVSPAVLVRTERRATRSRAARPSAVPLVQKATLRSSKDEGSPAVVFHRVKRGESLQQIALKYDLPLSDLARLNDLRLSDPLFVGKKLRVAKLSALEPPESVKAAPKEDSAASRKTESRKSGTAFHKVRWGETLDAIAKQHDTSLARLLRLNEMSLKDPLYAGKIIKVSGEEPAENTKENESGKTREKTKISQPLRTVPSFSSYEVQKGDSLASIAQEHHTTPALLRKLNSLKRNEALLAGARIRIPEAKADTESKEGKNLSPTAGAGSGKKKGKLVTYKVKRGDTLDTIARKYKTRVDVLLALNKMKPSDPLLANQALKLPGDSSFF